MPGAKGTRGNILAKIQSVIKIRFVDFLRFLTDLQGVKCEQWIWRHPVNSILGDVQGGKD